MKKIALRQYIDLKKTKEKFQAEKTIYANSNFLAKEDFEKIQKAQDNSVLKPVYKDGNYYIIKLISKIKPQTLPFEQVKDKIEASYIAQVKNSKLQEKADKMAKNFEGVSLGYIQKDSKPSIKGLSEDESANVVRDIFNSTSKISQSKLGDKIVVFKIIDSKLAAYDPKNDEIISSSIEQLKNNEINNGLLSQLKNKYEIKTFIGKN
jgi:peptidyl-prolyl cis-trans isomerase D